MQNNELLKNFRAQIETLDKEIIYLLSRRFTIVNEIWIIKKEENIPPLQTDRWNSLLNDNIYTWEELGLNKEIIIDIWNRIHEESLRIEK